MNRSQRISIVFGSGFAAALCPVTTNPARADVGGAGPVVYELTDESTFQEGCFPPCRCALHEEVPVSGTFTLTLIDRNPLFDTYAVEDVNWTVRTLDGDRSITGSGRYRIGGEVALTHQLELDLVVGESESQPFDSGQVVGGSTFPEIHTEISMNNRVCYDRVIDLHARPRCGDDGTIDWQPSHGGYGDPYWIDPSATSLEEGILRVAVESSGGCREHCYILRFGGYDANASLATFYLHHDANGDMCEAIVRRDLTFDLGDFLVDHRIGRLLLEQPNGATLEFDVPLPFDPVVLEPSPIDFNHGYGLDPELVFFHEGILHATVAASGGCGEHDFVLHLNGLVEAQEPLPVFFIRHTDHDDPCDGIFRRDLLYDLRDYVNQVGATRIMLLRPNGPPLLIDVGGCPEIIAPDFDGDCDVDGADFGALLACLSGPAIPYDPTNLPPGCYPPPDPDSILPVDLDRDGDVDQTDVGLCQRCLSGEGVAPDPTCLGEGLTPFPRIEHYRHGECLAGPGGAGTEAPCGESSIDLEVAGDTLHVTRHGARYNCCLDDVLVELTADGRVLRLLETEITTAPCRCLCCYEVQADVSGLTPGTYRVEYCWRDGGVEPTCLIGEIAVP